MQNIGPGPLHGALKSVPKEARRKLLTTVAYKLGDTPAWYAMEGSIAIAGAAITWLRDNLEVIKSYTDVEDIAKLDTSTHGLFFVPAFQGEFLEIKQQSIGNRGIASALCCFANHATI